MKREPFSLIVSRPEGLSPEGYEYAATLVQREADKHGLDVAVVTITPKRRRVRAWPFGGAR